MLGKWVYTKKGKVPIVCGNMNVWNGDEFIKCTFQKIVSKNLLEIGIKLHTYSCVFCGSNDGFYHEFEREKEIITITCSSNCVFYIESSSYSKPYSITHECDDTCYEECKDEECKDACDKCYGGCEKCIKPGEYCRPDYLLNYILELRACDLLPGMRLRNLELPNLDGSVRNDISDEQIQRIDDGIDEFKEFVVYVPEVVYIRPSENKELYLQSSPCVVDGILIKGIPF